MIDWLDSTTTTRTRRRHLGRVLALAALAAPASSQARAKVEPPPGLVRIEGGATVIGSTTEYATSVGVDNELNFPIVVYETPRHSSTLDDFFLMVSEVTNEQYEAFVRATDRQPPQSWGARAIDKAHDVRVLEIAEQQARAKAAGEKPPEYPEFDRHAWWEHNWRNESWEVPADSATRPVVFVNYADVVAYARWAGLRPMTEFEFQRAGRGKGTALYPWGDDPDPTRLAVVELVVDGKKVQPDRPFPVGSFPRSATASGVYDLSGNVWEWTSSPFVAYPGYRDLQIEVGAGKSRRKVDGLPAWNVEQRVVVGGSFQTALFAARLTTRRPTDRAQSTDSLGFRCAASAVPGLDHANAVLEQDFREENRPAGVRFDATKLLAAEHWQSMPGHALTKLKDKQGEQDLALPKYAVITGYDYLVYVPAVDLEIVSVQQLNELSRRTGLVYLGLLSTSKPVREPQLAAGSYLVGYVAARSADAAHMPAHFDPSVDNLVFCDLAGNRLDARPAPQFTFAHPAEPTLTLASSTRSVSTAENGEAQAHDEPVTLATLNVTTWARLSNRGVSYALQLLFAQGDVTDEWRHP